MACVTGMWLGVQHFARPSAVRHARACPRHATPAAQVLPSLCSVILHTVLATLLPKGRGILSNTHYHLKTVIIYNLPTADSRRSNCRDRQQAQMRQAPAVCLVSVVPVCVVSVHCALHCILLLLLLLF